MPSSGAELIFEAELRDPFWSTSFRKKYPKSWGLSARSDPLHKLGGSKRDDGTTLERRSKEWALVDHTVGATAPRLVLNHSIGSPILGPGPQYDTSTSFEKCGKFSSFAAFQIQGRESWRETAAARLEKTRAKTPVNLLSMTGGGGAVALEQLPGTKKLKDKKKKLLEQQAAMKAAQSPVKDSIGPGYYDIDRPIRQELLSSLTSAGRTKIRESVGQRIRRSKLNKVDLFEDRPDYRNYNVALELGKGARKVFIDTKEQRDVVVSKTGTSDRVGPGVYDVISALERAARPSPKARWLAKFTFSTDPAVEVPFSRVSGLDL